MGDGVTVITAHLQQGVSGQRLGGLYFSPSESLCGVNTPLCCLQTHGHSKLTKGSKLTFGSAQTER